VTGDVVCDHSRLTVPDDCRILHAHSGSGFLFNLDLTATMSDRETTPEPRRSQRERRPAKPFLSGMCACRSRIGRPTNTPIANSAVGGSKRKRGDDRSDNEELTDPEDNESPLSEEEGEEYATATKPRANIQTRAKKVSSTNSGGKKPRAAAPRATRTAGAARKPRKGRTAGQALNEADMAKETKITMDNVLFSKNSLWTSSGAN
jgi:cohesin complex subunit SA-1/2